MDSASKITPPRKSSLTGMLKKRNSMISKCKSIMCAGNFSKLGKCSKISHIKCSCFFQNWEMILRVKNQE
jgi:hypothetical protein